MYIYTYLYDFISNIIRKTKIFACWVSFEMYEIQRKKKLC